MIIPVAVLLLTQKVDLPENTVVTLFLASAAPGAPFAPKLAAIAGGDLASAIGLTFILSILAVTVMPVVIRLMYASGDDAFINILPIIGSLVFFQLLPLLAGLAIRHQNKILAKRLLPPTKIISDIFLVILLILVVSKHSESLFSVGWSSLVAMVIFNMITLISAWGLGNFETRTRKSLTLTTASRNLALVLLVAVESFPTLGMEVAVVAFGLIELTLTLLAAFYLRRFC